MNQRSLSFDRQLQIDKIVLLQVVGTYIIKPNYISFVINFFFYRSNDKYL